MLCACNQQFCVQNGCHNNKNKMSDSITRCPILKVYMWDNVVARKGRILAESLKMRRANGYASGSDAS